MRVCFCNNAVAILSGYHHGSILRRHLQSKLENIFQEQAQKLLKTNKTKIFWTLPRLLWPVWRRPSDGGDLGVLS